MYWSCFCVYAETQEELEDGFRLLLVRNNLLLNLLKKAGITPPEFIASKIFNYVVAQHQINGNVDIEEDGSANAPAESNQTSTIKQKLKNSQSISDEQKANEKKVDSCWLVNVIENWWIFPLFRKIKRRTRFRKTLKSIETIKLIL